MPEGFFPDALLPQITPISTLIPKCGACGLWKHCKSPKMEVDGEGRKGILILGESPGSREDDLNRPFVGKTGQHLEKVLRSVGINFRKDCWITNSAICRPESNKLPPKSILYCRPNVLKTIEELKPHTIILLGKSAVKSLIGYLWREEVGDMQRWLGWKIPSVKLNAWVCPTWHPSYVVRWQSELQNDEGHPVVNRYWERHLREASELQSRPYETVPHYPSQVELVYDPREAAKIIRKMVEKGGPIAFDYEADRLKPDSKDSRIVSCSLCWRGKKTIAFPWHGEAIKAVREFLQSPVPKVVSNLDYEERWSIAVLGTRVRNWRHDTMLSTHTLDNRPEICSVKFQAFVKLGVDPWDVAVRPYLKSKGGPRDPNRIKECPLDKLLLYNGLDSLYEYKVAEVKSKELGRPL